VEPRKEVVSLGKLGFFWEELQVRHCCGDCSAAGCAVVTVHEAAPLRPQDPGLQAERTALAWNRTGLAVLVNALLALRTGWVSRTTPITALAFALLMASGAAFLYGAWRRRHLLNGRGATAPPAIAMAATAVVTLIACATGVAAILMH
jgi:uncharacterized membrane protein YidH (DUF202 family)